VEGDGQQRHAIWRRLQLVNNVKLNSGLPDGFFQPEIPIWVNF
jgi:hypothetical protein